jgi:hypothetical protein
MGHVDWYGANSTFSIRGISYDNGGQQAVSLGNDASIDGCVTEIALHGDLDVSLDDLIRKFGTPEEMLIHRTIRPGRFGGTVHSFF